MTMPDPMVIDLLSSDEDDPPPADVGVAAQGVDFNQIEINASNENFDSHSDPKISELGPKDGQSSSVVLPVTVGQPQGIEVSKALTEDGPQVSNEAVGGHESIQEKPESESELRRLVLEPRKSGQDSDDEICEIVEEVRIAKKILSPGLNFGDDEFYKKAILLFKKDPSIMRELIRELIAKNDPFFKEKSDQVNELKARQEYRRREVEELTDMYKRLQSDVYRLGNPLDV